MTRCIAVNHFPKSREVYYCIPINVIKDQSYGIPRQLDSAKPHAALDDLISSENQRRNHKPPFSYRCAMKPLADVCDHDGDQTEGGRFEDELAVDLMMRRKACCLESSMKTRGGKRKREGENISGNVRFTTKPRS